MSAASPPPSPTKRNILRTLWTGFEPTNHEEHARRWNRPTGPPSPVKPSQQANMDQVGSGRVAGLVQGWEASLSGTSRPYSAIPPHPTSASNSSNNAPTPSRAIPPSTYPSYQPQPTSPTSPSSPRSPTTVPAAFFQAGQARRNPPQVGGKAVSASQPGKENQQRPPQPFNPYTRPSPATSSSSYSDSARSPATSAGSIRTDVSRATTASTVETMATRSSESTHASSLVTNSAEDAVVGVAARIPVANSEATPRKPAMRAAAPQIVETAPTPARRPQAGPLPARPVSIPSFDSRPSPSSSSPFIRPPALEPAQRPPPLRPQSSFYEDLRPSRSPEPIPHPFQQPSALPSPTLETNRYKPLPLDNTPFIRQGESASAPPPKTRGRPRASSLGAGLKQPFREEEVRVETLEEKKRRVEVEFEKLLDTMQLPDRTVRNKMLGLALPIKEEMLASASKPSSLSSSTLGPPSRPSHQRGRSLNLADSQPPSRAPTPNGSRNSKKEGGGSGFKTFLRKTKSGNSLREKAQKDGSASLSVSASSGPRGDGDRPTRPRSHSRTASATSILFRSFGKSSGAAAAAQVAAPPASAEVADAATCASWLRSTRCAQLGVKELGRLRGRLRTESPAWVDEFIKSGGYLGMLERLKELLEMEWREDVHDDAVLHEVLRCFKALTMSAVGKRALASHSPTPFLPLASLLFSEKRPGDLPCRQLLVELIQSLFEICPLGVDALPKTAWATPEVNLDPTPVSPCLGSGSFGANSSSNGGSGGVRRYTRKAKSGDEADDVEREEVLTPERVQQTRRLVVSLMMGPPDEKEDAKVDFIQVAHRPRVFKTWVTEIADCVRDYFWVFCHPNNLFWTLEQINADEIEAPKVPSGMTGGVEYEAMAYATAHFRLINALARSAPTMEAAFRFHNELFDSGFERVLFTLRRASLVYYQSLHLEMSRYISLARSAQFNLGARILQCLDRRFLSAQEVMVLQQVEEAQRRQQRQASGAPRLDVEF
ncbi:hypothetical protein JCM8097_007404 [Rhodosporidiobolus ruineniae]